MCIVCRRKPTTRLQDTARGLAVLHLLRIEQDNAYSALLAKTAASSQDSTAAGDPWIAPAPSSTVQVPSSSSLPSVPTTEEQQQPLEQSIKTDSANGTKANATSYLHSTRETTRLVAGVTRWRRQLDCTISNVAERSMDSMDPSVRQVQYLCSSLQVAPLVMETSNTCLLYTSPSPRDRQKSRMPSSA